MLFRGLPDGAKRDALLIDVNDFANRHKAKAGTSPAGPSPDDTKPPALSRTASVAEAGVEAKRGRAG